MNSIKSEKGFTLIVVLMVLVVLSVLTTAVIGLAVNNSAMIRGERDDQSTFYIAEAGINSMIAEIEEIAKVEANKKQSIPTDQPELAKQLFNSGVKSEIKEHKFKFKLGYFQQTFGKTLAIANVSFIDELPEGLRYKIESTGSIGNKKRTLERVITISFEPNEIPGSNSGEDGNSGNSGDKGPVVNVPEGVAVFVNGKITMAGGAKIEGNIGTNQSGNKTISLSGGASVTGGVYVPKGSENGAITTTEGIKIAAPTGMTEAGMMQLPEFPAFPEYQTPNNQVIKNGNNQYGVIQNGNLSVDNWMTDNYVLKMTDNMMFNEIKLGSNYTMTIDVGDTDKVIVVENLNVLNGHINIIGTGKLTFLVKGNITMGSGSTINNGGSVDQLGVYLQKSSNPNKPKDVKLDGAQKIFGSLYAEDANIHVTGGGGFQGNIFTGGKNVTISGGGSAQSSLILAPNADVKLTGGGNVKGAIYANTLYADGGTIVKYKKPTIETGPFAPSPEIPGPNPRPNSSGGTSHIKLDALLEL